MAVTVVMDMTDETDVTDVTDEMNVTNEMVVTVETVVTIVTDDVLHTYVNTAWLAAATFVHIHSEEEFLLFNKNKFPVKTN